VFRHKYYRRVLIAQAISNIGTWTELFAIQMFVAKSTGRLDDQSVLGMCQLLPILVLGLLGGLTADRVNRRTLLVVTQMLAGLVAAGVATVSMIGFADPRTAVHWLFFLGALNGCIMAFNFPAWQVLTPRLVPKGDLTSAITVNGIQFNMARVLGPVIAGYVLALYGPPPLLWFNALTFIGMGIVVWTTPDAPAPPRTGEPIRRQIREAVAFIFSQRGPRAVFVAQVLLSLLAAPLVRLLSNFVLDVYRLSDAAAEKTGGKLLALQGIGAVAGGLALRYVPSWYPKHHFIPLSVAGLGLSICLFALVTTPALGLAAMLVCGWFWIWAFNQSWAAIQVLTPDRLRGRALSLTNVASFGATALGVVIAGYSGEALKPESLLGPQRATQASILILSVPLLLAGVWMLVWRVPEVDGMTRVPRAGWSRFGLLSAVAAREHWPRKKSEAEVDDPEAV
jgi:MFS family permease